MRYSYYITRSYFVSLPMQHSLTCRKPFVRHEGQTNIDDFTNQSDMQAQTGGIMEIKRAGAQASMKEPSEWFTGTVRIDPLFEAPDPALVQAATVTFEPGARTA